jgi:rod shape-determining protein MreC
MLLLGVCFVLVTLDLGGGGLRSAHSGVRGVLGALYRGTDGVLGPARRFVQGLPSAGSNESRVQALQRQVAQLQGELNAHAVDRSSAAQLHRLQLAADSGGYQVLPARVVALGAGQGFDWTVTLDVGTTSGVRPGQTVIDGTALVGRVLHADRSTCVVLLGADPGSGVGARDLRTGQVGIATGAGTAGFQFVPLDPHASLRPGDQLVTGPVGSTSYATGLPVGVLTAVRSGTDGTVRADVHAAASPTGLDLVGVIVDPQTAVAGGRQPLDPASPTSGGQ